MKLNIAYPASGCQKLIDVEDEKKLRVFFDKRMSQEVDASSLGDEWKGYVVRISGGNDKQGFPMKQGVLSNGRVRLLLAKGHSCYRPRRTGERRRKSVRGCIVDANLAVLSLVIVKKGDGEIPGLTDGSVPRRLGPKRASKIRKLFNLTKEDDVRQYVLRRALPAKEGKKPRSKAPKIQRLVTPVVLQRKRHRLSMKRRRATARKEEASSYAKLIAQRAKERAAERIARRRSSASARASQSQSSDPGKVSISKEKPTTKPKAPTKEAPKMAPKETGKVASKEPPKATAKPAAKETGKPPAKEAAKPPAKEAAKPPAKEAAKPPAKEAAKPPAKETGKPPGKDASKGAGGKK